MQRIPSLSPILPICLLFISAMGLAQPIVEFEEVELSGPDLVQPVDIVNNGVDADRIYIVEKRGTVRIIENGTVLGDFFLDISDQVTNIWERGLLGLEFHPAYPDSPYYYVNYTDLNSDSHIARFTVNSNNTYETLAGSELTILFLDQPYDNHNGGDLSFGPDGYLYIGFGDGGSAGDPQENAQNLNSLFGKMLRIDVNTGNPYAIPPDNPFVGQANVMEEIWAYGLRNPWRFSFDNSGNLWIADVGQNMFEEVSYQEASSTGGENYGWDCYEGNASYELAGCPPQGSFVFPILTYPRDSGTCITGGFVYEGQEYPSLQDYYICIDYYSNRLWLLHNNGSGFDTIVQVASGINNNISTFGEDANGELYAASLNGPLYRVIAQEPLAITIAAFTARLINNAVELQWRFADLEGADRLIIERSGTDYLFDAIHHLDDIPLTGSFRDTDELSGIYYYRLKILNEDGSAWTSPIRAVKHSDGTSVYITTSDGVHYSINVTGKIEQEVNIEIISSDGKVVKSNDIQFPRDGSYPLDVSSLSPGVYFVRSTLNHKRFLDKILVR